MKLNYLTIIIASLLLSMYSCGPSKNIPQNEVVQTIPCEGKQYETTKDHFRASAQGVSPYQQMAKDIAIQNAKQTLAGLINSRMDLVIDNYAKQSNLNAGVEVMNRYESLGRTVVSQSIPGIVIICGVSTKDKDRESISYNQYKYYVSVEIASNDIMESVNNALSNDEVLKVDYNYEKFKETFDEEMKKFSSRD